MNNYKSNQHIEQQQKFNRKLNHLQGFIGMPNWNFDSPTFDEIKEYEQCGRKLQAKAFQSFSKRLKSWLLKATIKIVRRRDI